MADDIIDGYGIFDKSDNFHWSSKGRAQQGVEFVDLPYHLFPALRQDKRLLCSMIRKGLAVAALIA
jgi:hypothetical protein